MIREEREREFSNRKKSRFQLSDTV